MTTDKDDNATVKFHHPYTPYPIQLDFMNALYDALESSKVGIFESPTGTGKTLSLICASMTWLRNNRKRELENALKELDKGEDPDWIKQEAKEMKMKEFTERAVQFEKKLEQIRKIEEQERMNTKRESNNVKTKKRKIVEKDKEENFLLDDYESDEENDHNSQKTKINKSGFSAEVQQLLDQIGKENTAGNGDEEMEQKTRIFFASRTHSQLSQFVGQLKMVQFPSSYNDKENETVKEISLSSRQQLCIHKKVSQYKTASQKNDACLDMQKKDATRCEYMLNMNKLEDKVKSTEFRGHALAQVRDIEDLAELGKEMHICPYYESRRAVQHSEVVTLPYQLLIQKSARKALGIDLKGAVVIVDEAHNIMDTISSLFSLSVDVDEVSRARRGVEIYQQKFNKRLNVGNRVYLAQTLKSLQSLEQFFEKASKLTKQKTKPGLEVNQQKIMEGTGSMINVYKLEKYLETSKLAFKIESYVEALEEGRDEKMQKLVLSKVISFIMAISNPTGEGKVFYDRCNGKIQLNYLLLDPSEQFKEVVEESRCVVLAGGTMEPVGDYLDHLFPYVNKEDIKLFNCGHVIPDENLSISIVENGPSNKPFSFTFANKGDKEMVDQLGKTLVSSAAVIPHGLVVFFPSYQILDDLINTWKASGIFERLNSKKKVFMEPRESSVESILLEYKKEIETKGGAILFSVVGGKMSEGINFSDNLARGVVMIGLPFPNLMSAEMVAKRDFIEQKVISNGGCKQQALEATKDFYENICMRAVNQSIGRAIRHANDYAAIILIDQRYTTERIQKKLPAWIKTRITTKEASFPKTIKTLGGFFKTRR